MAFKLLDSATIRRLIDALHPRFLGRDQDHLITLADETGAAAYEAAQTYVEPLYDFRTDIQSSGGSELVGFLSQGTEAVPRSVKGKLDEIVSVKDFGAKGDGIADDTAAINAAVAAVAERGGGFVMLPAGTFLLSNSNPGAGNWDNKRAIYIGSDDVVIVGSGNGTVLKLANGANCHPVQIGQRVETIKIVSGCGVMNLVIDGNRANQVAPTETDDHFSGITVSSGCSDIRIERVEVKNCCYYGIGFQRDNFQRCTVRDVYIHDVGGDGIDWKDDSEINSGNVIHNVRVERHGLATGLLTDQAGIDLRGGVTATNIVVADFGTVGLGKVGIRTQQGTTATGPADLPVQTTSVSNFYVRPNTSTGTTGVRTITPHARVSNGEVWGAANGVWLSYREPHVSNVAAQGCGAGFRLLAASGTGATNGMYSACLARSCTQAGVIVDADCIGNEFTNCVVRGNALGYDIRSGSVNTKILGGSCAANTIAASDAGTATLIRNVEGLRTEQAILSSGIPIDSTGVKNITFNHLLGFTPNIADVDLTMVRDTNVGDWSSGLLWVTAATSTTITAQMRVLTASATAGATVKVRANVRTKNGI